MSLLIVDGQADAHRASSLFTGYEEKISDPYKIIEVERLQNQLQQKAKVLFNGSRPSIHIWETSEDNGTFQTGYDK